VLAPAGLAAGVPAAWPAGAAVAAGDAGWAPQAAHSGATPASPTAANPLRKPRLFSDRATVPLLDLSSLVLRHLQLMQRPKDTTARRPGAVQLRPGDD
jgi:hypothetical protein